jgi:hypothetical protein
MSMPFGKHLRASIVAWRILLIGRYHSKFEHKDMVAKGLGNGPLKCGVEVLLLLVVEGIVESKLCF